jgi:hypothetical protein
MIKAFGAVVHYYWWLSGTGWRNSIYAIFHNQEVAIREP